MSSVDVEKWHRSKMSHAGTVDYKCLN